MIRVKLSLLIWDAPSLDVENNNGYTVDPKDDIGSISIIIFYIQTGSIQDK
jgi:hypothetical protein